MKANNLLRFLTLAACALVFAFVAGCEGPVGPAGPTGAAGTAGANGSDGTNGVDGNAVCMECHNLTTKQLVTDEYNESGHANAGFELGYAGVQVDCGKCHSDQGFRETQYSGLDTLFTSLAKNSAQPIQCATCHDFHPSLDFENEPNSALRTRSQVALLMYRRADPASEPVYLDLGDASNLCANCHQPLTSAPIGDEGGDASITSSHYGPHHGPHSTSLGGIGAYEVGTGYPSPGEGSVHATSTTCITCHMYEKEHTLEPNLDACNTSSCHGGSITSLTDNSRQEAFRTLLETLKTELTTAGLLDAEGHPVPGTFGVDSVGAVYNYEWLIDDGSSGVHNFPYLETMVNNSIAVFE